MVFEFTYNTHRCPWLIINSFWGLFGVLGSFRCFGDVLQCNGSSLNIGIPYLNFCQLVVFIKLNQPTNRHQTFLKLKVKLDSTLVQKASVKKPRFVLQYNFHRKELHLPRLENVHIKIRGQKLPLKGDSLKNLKINTSF